MNCRGRGEKERPGIGGNVSGRRIVGSNLQEIRILEGGSAIVHVEGGMIDKDGETKLGLVRIRSTRVVIPIANLPDLCVDADMKVFLKERLQPRSWRDHEFPRNKTPS